MWLLLLSILLASEPEMSLQQLTNRQVDVVVEEVLPEVKVSRGSIVLGNGVAFEVTSEASHELRHHLNELSPQDLEVFKQKRVERLLWLAKKLSYDKLSSGIGFIENEKLSMIKDGVMRTHPIDELSALEHNLNEKELSELNKDTKISRRLNVIAKILKYYDNESFKSAKKFVSGREYCFDLLLAPMSVIGLGRRMFGGSFGINIIIGYDVTSRRLSFQVKRIHEMARVGMAFMPLGLNARVGAFSRSTAYVPSTYSVAYTPGLPMYKVSGDGIRGGGFSAPITILGILTGGAFSVAENFMTYTGANHTVTLIDTGFTLKFPSISKLFSSLKAMISYGSRNRCAPLFE